ncbi:hypothetical protein PR048_005205 [Dryococelus australis]|uniref:Uncharacterized protein n=1 Tax=Dryococelus australis TaxID=614101 RepID=A0ABQ9I7I7_9NEOP|nr:hypothetical protein PR048_005205 [Dryococelus australis]
MHIMSRQFGNSYLHILDDKDAFLRAAVMQTAISGFEKIWNMSTELECNPGSFKLLTIPLTHQARMNNCHEMVDNPLQEET